MNGYAKNRKVGMKAAAMNVCPVTFERPISSANINAYGKEISAAVAGSPVAKAYIPPLPYSFLTTSTMPGDFPRPMSPHSATILECTRLIGWQMAAPRNIVPFISVSPSMQA